MPRFAIALALVLLGCAQDDSGSMPGASDVQPSGHALSAVLGREQAGSLVAYAFDGGAPVPAGGLAGEVTIEYGEIGADGHTRLYRTFDGDAGTGEPRVPGRFGQALSLAVGSRVVMGSMELFERPAVISFWLQQDPAGRGQAGRILESGELSLRVTADNYCRLNIAGAEPLGLKAGPLREDEWNHVAIALDGPLLDQVRLIVNDAYATRRMPAPLRIVPGKELFFGGKAGFIGALDDFSIRGFQTPTADLLARWPRRAAPGAHVLELERADDTERLSLWAGVLTAPTLTTAEDWRTAELRHVVAGADGLRAVPGHWERTHAADPPLARTTHPTVYVGDHEVFIFGGETRDTHGWVWQNTSDTWIYHTDEGRWEPVVTDEHPEPSCHQPAAYSPDHDLVLYPGGWRNDVDPTVHYPGTWFFHPRERRWERRAGKGLEFPGTSDSGLVYHPGERKFYAFIAGRKRVWSFDPELNRWGRMPEWKGLSQTGEPVEFRLHGSPMVDYDPARGTILYFGGRQGAKGRVLFSDRTASFDPQANTFTVLDTQQAPAPRVRSGFAHDAKRGYFVLFGGVLGRESQRFSDLWIFDPADSDWREVEASNPPSARGGYYGMAYEPDLDRFFLLCGRHSQRRFLDEVWSLELDEGATGLATFVFDRSGFAERQWFAEAEEPGDASVTYRFRGAEELGSFGAWSDTPAADSRYVMVQVSLTPGSAGEQSRVTAMGFRP